MFLRKVALFIFLFCFVLGCKANAKYRLLNVGDSARIEVKANKHFMHTGIKILKGASYRIIAAGTWRDAGFEPTDAGGFPPKNAAMRFARFLQPDCKENYMKLVAKVGNHHWPIGTGAAIHFKRKGNLVLQPNDATFFFGNNSGTLSVTIIRVE